MLLILAYSLFRCMLPLSESQWSLLSYQDLGHHQTMTYYSLKTNGQITYRKLFWGPLPCLHLTARGMLLYSQVLCCDTERSGPFMVGLDDLQDLFQAKWFYDPVIGQPFLLSLGSLDTDISPIFKSKAFRSVIKQMYYIHDCILVDHFFCDSQIFFSFSIDACLRTIYINRNS